MRPLFLRGELARAPRRSCPAAVFVLVLAVTAHAQSPFGSAPPTAPGPRSPFGSSAPPAPATAPRTAAAVAVTPAAADILARVEGRAITQAQFDAIATPYLSRLRAEMGAGLTPDVLKLARRNVFDELVRREVLALEARRTGVTVTEAETDALLHADPSLQSNGRFDPAKLREFKLSPQSNYNQLLPLLRETAATARLDRQLRDRFQPSPAALRAEFEKRNATARFRFLALQTRDMSLEPESEPDEWRRYYDAHTSEFVQRAQVRVRWQRWPLPGPADSTRAAAEAQVLARAQAVADSLRAGTLVDSVTLAQDTRWFERGATVPGLGREPALLAAIARADSVPAEAAFGPLRLSDGVVLGKVVERRAERVPPLREVVAEARRRADAEKRRSTAEADRRAWFDANRERYRGARARLTRLTLRMGSYQGRAISPAEVDAWYLAHGRSLFGLADSSTAWLPPIDESRRREAGRAMAEGERERWLASTMATLANGLATARDPVALARANGAVAETLSLAIGVPGDSLFPPVVADSVRITAATRLGQVQGPRAFGAYSVVWRVDAADTAFFPTFEAARPRIEPDFAASRRAQDEADGRDWHARHAADYPAPPRHVVEYVAVPVPPADSVRIDEAVLRAEYAREPARHREAEQVRARHLLLSTREGGPDADARAAARADSLLAAIRSGGDFFDLARRFSQEPGAAGSGGDLGWFGRGRMVPEFERAAFALKVGEVSGVVKTQFGYHIIKLEDRKSARLKPFAEVRPDLRATLAVARADSGARRAAEALRRKFVAAPAAGVAPLAAIHGGLRTSAAFATNETLGGVGPAPGLAEDVARLAAGRWAGRVYRAANSYLVARALRTEPPRPSSFEEVRARAVEDAKTARRRELLERKVVALRTALAAGASLDSLAAPHGGLKDSGPVNRSFGFVPGLGLEPRLVEHAFSAAAGAVSDTLHTAQGVAWLECLGRDTIDDRAFAAAQPALAQELLKQGYDAWVAARQRTLRVEILRPEFKGGR